MASPLSIHFYSPQRYENIITVQKKYNNLTNNYLNDFLIHRYTGQLTTKHSLTIVYNFYIRCPEQLQLYLFTVKSSDCTAVSFCLSYKLL